MKKILLILIFTSILLILPLMTAEQVNKDLIINIQCTNSTYVNITSIINKVNSTYVLKGEINLSKSGNNYNYTLNSTLNNQIGKLEISYHCDINGIDKSAGFLIDITKTGSTPNTSEGIIYVVVIIISFILFLSGLIWCFYTDTKYLKLGLGLLSYILFTWILFVLWQLSDSFLIISGLTNILRIFFIATTIGLFPAFILAFLITAREIYVDIAEKKLLQRGINPNG